jgi:hypothetical protein
MNPLGGVGDGIGVMPINVSLLRKHSANIQGTFRAYSDQVEVEAREPPSQLQEAHSGNIQGTFREHSGNIQGTFREHSGNIQGTFREHSGNIQGALRPLALSVSMILLGLKGLGDADDGINVMPSSFRIAPLIAWGAACLGEVI